MVASLPAPSLRCRMSETRSNPPGKLRGREAEEHGWAQQHLGGCWLCPAAL